MNQQEYIDGHRKAEAELRQEFPELFSECFSLSCPPGWVRIVRSLSYSIRRVAPETRVVQVKPKAGSLRYYLSGQASDHVNDLIGLAASIAGKTCQGCGGPGEPKGWNVLCDGCCR